MEIFLPLIIEHMNSDPLFQSLAFHCGEIFGCHQSFQYVQYRQWPTKLYGAFIGDILEYRPQCSLGISAIYKLSRALLLLFSNVTFTEA